VQLAACCLSAANSITRDTHSCYAVRTLSVPVYHIHILGPTTSTCACQMRKTAVYIHFVLTLQPKCCSACCTLRAFQRPEDTQLLQFAGPVLLGETMCIIWNPQATPAIATCGPALHIGFSSSPLLQYCANCNPIGNKKISRCCTVHTLSCPVYHTHTHTHNTDLLTSTSAFSTRSTALLIIHVVPTLQPTIALIAAFCGHSNHQKVLSCYM
jgi:hypothetical protein